MGTVILGTGSYLPEKILSNHDLEEIVDTSDEWITSRTGISNRRIAGDNQTASTLAANAAGKALEMAGIGAEEIDLIILGSMSSHMLMPSCACLVQNEIGAVNAFAFDINAACSGFLYALDVADKYLRADPDIKVLVIGSEVLSARLNWQDRNTCILFGDGAGAVVLGSSDSPRGLVGTNLFSDGRLWNLLYMPGPPDLSIHTKREQDTDQPVSHIKMEGREVFKHAVRAMESAVLELVERENIDLDDIKLVIPHQANIRILRKLLSGLGINKEKVFINVHKYGNTSAASIPIALDEANREGKVQAGDLILICSFGGGFTWGAALINW